MEIGFGEALLVLGLVLAAASALSGVMHGTVLSISVLSVGAGIVLALTDVITVDPGSQALIYIVELALILTLFSDGLLVEREFLRDHWGVPARALTVAMPVTMVLIALAAKLLFTDLSWAESFLIGAVLAPTDPVVTSSVVSSKGVPQRVRYALNIESGLNDGLALPFVLFFLILATPGGDAGESGLELLGEAAAGAAIGVALGLGTGRLLPRLPLGGLSRRYEGVFALGVALAAFGIADVTIGNGLVAAFIAGIALAAADPEVLDVFSEFNESVSATFQVVAFIVFGALIVATGFDGSAPALAAFIVVVLLLARPAAVLGALAGSGLPRPQKLFIAWFGPKGVASMLFALFVLDSTAPDRTLVFDIASFVVLASIAAHGLTDTVGARWIERQMQAHEAPAR